MYFTFLPVDGAFNETAQFSRLFYHLNCFFGCVSCLFSIEPVLIFRSLAFGLPNELYVVQHSASNEIHCAKAIVQHEAADK